MPMPEPAHPYSFKHACCLFLLCASASCREHHDAAACAGVTDTVMMRCRSETSMHVQVRTKKYVEDASEEVGTFRIEDCDAAAVGGVPCCRKSVQGSLYV